MARRATSALEELVKLDMEQAKLLERRRQALAAAAREMGEVVLDAVGTGLSPDQVRSLLVVVMEVGFETAMARLRVGPPAATPAPARAATGRGDGGAALPAGPDKVVAAEAV